MKVIVAGLPKTGTTSLSRALRLLGYNVLDLPDQVIEHGKEWMKILSEQTSKKNKEEELKKMYQDTDVVSDAPAVIYWQEIHEDFKDAKVKECAQ